MAGRLDKVRNLKLEVPDETSAPARRWGFWLFLAVVVAGGAFLALKNMPLQSSAATVAASDAALPSAPIDTPAPNGFTAVGYVEPVPPFPIHVSPLVLGRIDEFTITEGQPVKAGKIIAKLNSGIRETSGGAASCSRRQCSAFGSR
jgi:multidrug efflux pump subunit AcrA (membrane-fusion protein)